MGVRGLSRFYRRWDEMSGDSQLATIILYAAGATLLGVFGWVVSVVRDLTREMTEWRVTLFGPPPQYENGMRGDIKSLRDDVDELMGKRFQRRAGDVS
jgi:hypothetical protein